MPSGTFAIFRILNFPPANRRTRYYKTEDRRPRGSVDERADPVYTAIRLTGEGAPGNFAHATVTHRKGVRIEGLWRGNKISEVVEQTRFDAYFDLGPRIFVAHAEKKIALSAAKDLNEDPGTGALFNLRTIEVDFRQIIPRAVNVIGAWFKEMQHTNVRTEAAFGDHITRDPEFTRLARLGNHSNLIVVMNFNGMEIKVNISRVGSAYFMEDYQLGTCLDFMVHLLQYERHEENPPRDHP